MQGSESINGILIICGLVMFLVGLMMIRIFHELDEDDKGEWE
jgi:hypothetical protein